MENRRIVIAGGSGFLGNILSKYLSSMGYEIVILTRRHRLDSDYASYRKWDAKNIGAWVHDIDGAYALINLNGKSVDCRYNEANKQAIYDTRTNATYILGKAVSKVQHPPKVWINASSATIYRHALDRNMDEETGEFGEGFSVDVCKKWEKAFFEVENPKTRKVALRIAIVLGKNGGALEPLKNLAKVGLGGRQGNGQQYFSWLHEIDFLRIIEHTLENESIEGVYNASAPNPIPNHKFMKHLRKAVGISLGLPLPEWLLKIGAMFIKTESELILKSRRVVPTKFLKSGFEFDYVTFEKAVKSLV